MLIHNSQMLLVSSNMVAYSTVQTHHFSEVTLDIREMGNTCSSLLKHVNTHGNMVQKKVINWYDHICSSA